jgi:hypothetical protein
MFRKRSIALQLLVIGIIAPSCSVRTLGWDAVDAMLSCAHVIAGRRQS